MASFDTDLAERKTLSSLVDGYQDAIAKVRQGYDILNDAQAQLDSLFGEHSYFYVLPNNARYSLPGAKEESLRELKKDAWAAIIQKSEVRKTLSIKRAAELDENLHNHPEKLAEITLTSVLDLLKLYVDNADQILNEAIAEVYDWLRPRESTHAADYKTNQKNATFELGKKIVLTYIVEHSFSQKNPFRTNSYREKYIMALDKVFHALDCKGVPDGYRSPLIDAINTTPDGKGETTYFKFTAYNNGNLHIEFKRLDLVSKLNQIAGGLNLKPAN